MILMDQQLISEMGIISSEVYDNVPSGSRYFIDNPIDMFVETSFGITSYSVIDKCDTQSGLQALLLQQNDISGAPTSEYVIVFRGTQGILDVGVDAVIGLANYNPQFEDAENFVQAALDRTDHDISQSSGDSLRNYANGTVQPTLILHTVPGTR